MRVVFDTNVLVSALPIENSTPARAFFAALDHGENLLLEALGNEIQRILRKRKFSRYITAEQLDEFLVALVQAATLVEVRVNGWTALDSLPK